MELAATIISVISAIAAIASAVISNLQRRDARAAAQEAQADATRAVAAAEQSAAAHTTLANHADAQANRPPWSLTHHNGDTYALTNVGNKTVHNITITGNPVHRPPHQHPELAASEAITFMALSTWDTTDDTIHVEWSDAPNGPTRNWEHPKPPKPKK